MIQIKNSKFWLTGIAASLVAIHLTTSWKRDYTDLGEISILLWAAVYSLIWKKHTTLNLKTDAISSLFGTVLIAVVLLETTFPINKFPYISPFISAIGLCLLASGFKGLKQYWQELLILLFPIVANITLLFLIDITELTAKFATFALWYSGFEVSREGVVITLKTGAVEVNQGCSGLENIIHLWLLAVLFLVMFTPAGGKKFLVPVVASLVGFIVNGVRVALMAILEASSNQKAFDYWHKGEGSLIFSLISVLIFGLFCLFILQLDRAKKQDFV